MMLVLIGELPAMSAELALLMISTAGAGVAAVFAVLCFVRTQQLRGALTLQGATQILRGETDIVRAAIERGEFGAAAKAKLENH